SPHHHEVPSRVRGHPRGILITGGVGVHLELGAQPCARAAELLAEDPSVGAALVIARPDHDEVACAVRSERAAVVALTAGGVGVDLELGADWYRLAPGVRSQADEDPRPQRR